jgi:hypothetical protein
MPSKTGWSRLHYAVVTLVFHPTPTSSHASLHPAITEISVQFSFHAQHFSAASKIISDDLLTLLMLELHMAAGLCIVRDGERQAFVEILLTTADNPKRQPEGKLRRLKKTHLSGGD